MAGTFLDDRQVVNRAPLSALGNTANLTLDVIMGDINTFFANATASATASVLMLRDANANTRANNFIEGFTTTVSSGTALVLTVGSTYFQQITGTAAQTVTLPNATTLVAGQSFLIANRSTLYATINANGGGLVQSMAPGSQTLLTVTSIGTSAGTWDSSYSVAGPIPFLQTNVTTDSTTTGSAATLLTGDILYGDVRLTNGSLVSVSGIPAGASGQQIIIENQTGNTIIVNNNDAGATAANRIFTGTGGAVAMAANASFGFVYDTTAARWMLVGGTGSGSSSGGGKNYLSAYTASTSSGVPNTGNGNFELGSTTGWALGTIGTLTNGLPTGSPTFGSGASGNLSISTVSGGTQIGGSYSLSYASSAATTAGNMVASNAFFIDAEDQGKILTVKFYYEVASGATNDNFSGTSSNSFAWAIYDVTNSAWLGTAGQFGMTQNSGTGYVTGTFQTAITTTQLRICIYNVNATSGATTLYFDDFSIGPQTAPFGPAMTDWGNQAWIPTGSWSTNSTYTGKWRRVGDSMEGWVRIALSGAPNSTQLTINVPSGYTIDTTKINATNNNSDSLGEGFTSSAGNTYPVAVAYESTSALRLRSATSASNPQLAFITQAAPATYANGDSVEIWFHVPIVGWSSNSSMSSDTDTRVVAAKYTGATATLSASYSNVTFTTLVNDTHASYSGATYTIPVTGYYDFSGQVYISGTASLNATTIVGLSKNSSVLFENDFTYAGAITGSVGIPFNFGSILCNAGDTIIIQAKSSITLPVVTSSATENFFQAKRLSGPAVIAATESVNMTYQDTSGGAIGTSFAVYKYTTQSFDSHAAYSTSTGIYTVPVSGKYQVSAVIQTATVTLTNAQVIGIRCLKNGSTSVVYGQLQGTGGSGNYTPILSGLVSCNAGDTLQIQVTSSVSTTAENGNASANSVSIARIGN